MIRPISFSAKPMNFKAYTIIGHDNEQVYSKEEDKKNEDKVFYIDQHTINQNIKNSLLAGAFIGAIIGGTTFSIYKDHIIKDSLNEITEEMSSDYFEKLKIEDSTKDSIPDIVVVDKNGEEKVYDITSGSVYLKDGKEIIKEIK